MKFSIKNLGVMKSAELELGDLTVICGENNTSKTRIIYAVYEFLRSAYFTFSSTNMEALDSKNYAKEFLKKGRVQINFEECIENLETIMRHVCSEYANRLSRDYASPNINTRPSDTCFSLIFDKETIDFDQEFSTASRPVSISKNKDSEYVDIYLLPDAENQDSIDEEYWNSESRINFAIMSGLYWQFRHAILASPFITDVERTGIVTFRRELNFARSEILKEAITKESDSELVNIVRKNYAGYPQAINDNINFLINASELSKRESYIAKKHPEIIDYFLEIFGGKAVVKDEDTIHYIPENSKAKLTMIESSGGVRALLHLFFYLKHSAQKGDLLMIDEPELNLHPKNQRKMAKLLAMLVNAGIKVFITTHSDYIVHELNILILLNSQDERLHKITKSAEYKKSVLLSHEKVKLYTAEQESKVKGSKNYTLEPVSVDSKSGIDIKTFNDEIRDMRAMQEKILFGGD